MSTSFTKTKTIKYSQLSIWHSKDKVTAEDYSTASRQAQMEVTEVREERERVCVGTCARVCAVCTYVCEEIDNS